MSPRPNSANGAKPDAGVPLHRQLFLVLHDEIARGALAPGDPLPTEQSLCEQFGVSRITVRRALSDLAEQGYIERRHGVGSFVLQHKRGASPVPGKFDVDDLKQIQFETDVDVLEFDHRAPPFSVSLRLGSTEPTLHVLRLRRERRTAEPLMITEAWLPAALSKIVTEKALERSALYELLPAAGVDIERIEHEMTAEVAGPNTARLLEIPIGAAVIRVNRVVYVGGEPHHYLSIALSPTRSRVLMSQNLPGSPAADRFAVAHDVGR